MSSGFLPTSDAGLLAWSANFSSLLTATPLAFGVTSAIATAYAALHETYATDLAACDPGVRNKTAVITKNNSRAALRTEAGLLSKLIGGTASVSNAQRATLGLNVKAAPTPTPPPSVAPALDVVSVNARTVQVRLHDADNAGKRGKPKYVKGACLYSFVGTTPPTDPKLFTFQGNTTETVVDVTFPDTVLPGATVWITAMWFNYKTQTGPAATPIMATIQYGMSMTG